MLHTIEQLFKEIMLLASFLNQLIELLEVGSCDRESMRAPRRMPKSRYA